MDKLISMTAFVKKYYSDETRDELQTLDLFDNYATFLLQPLMLGQFVPCDENGDFMISPDEKENKFRQSYDGGWWNEFVDYKNKYFKAQEKVLFTGFHYAGYDTVTNDDLKLSIDVKIFQFMQVGSLGLGGGDIGGVLLENIAICDLQIELTESALQEIGIKNK